MINQVVSTGIDSELKAKYSDAPFEFVKENLLNDDSAIIITPNQYRALLEYRLKNYRAKSSYRKPTRTNYNTTEKLPDWYNNEHAHKQEKTQKEVQQAQQEIENQLKQLRGE